MIDDMGMFRTQIEIAPLASPDRRLRLDDVLVERSVGFAFVYAGGRSTPSLVVFAEEGDMTLMGAIALEGPNLRVDLVRRELATAGPVPVACLVA